MKLLYAEDERALSEAVVDVLTYHKYGVDAVFDGSDALAYAESGQYDGIILDVMMPKMSGLEVLKKLRAVGNKTPILLLTAKSEITDKIEGLDAGADDYLPKPFAMGELLARVRAMLRRKENYTPDILSMGNIALNRGNGTLHVGGIRADLPNLEYKMLEILMLNRGICLSTEELLCKVWGYDTDAEAGIVWVYIAYLRRRLATLNYDTSATITGGVFIGTGASGMAQTFSSGTQGVFAVQAGNLEALTEFTISDSAGNVLLTHAPRLSYSVIIYSAPEVKKGEIYTIAIGQTSGSFAAQ